MIKEALEYIRNLSVAAERPHIETVEGSTYADKRLIRYEPHIDIAEPISGNTLTSMMRYIEGKTEELRDQMIILIKSPTEVSLVSGFLENRTRETLFIARAIIPQFHYEDSYPQERFIVAMQSCFADFGDRDAVIQLASNIIKTNEAVYTDSGIGQYATIKTGVASKANAEVPNPVTLKPYRTFAEVDQPESDFIFRLCGKEDSPNFSITEADGGAWKNKAIANIEEYVLNAIEVITTAHPELQDRLTVIA